MRALLETIKGRFLYYGLAITGRLNGWFARKLVDHVAGG